jgi:hypothetical protein
MATQTIVFEADADLTLSAVVYPVGSNSAFASVTPTQAARKGIYSFTLSGSSGVYEIHISETAGRLGILYVETTNTAATFDAVGQLVDLSHSASLSSLLSRVPAALFAGITSLANWLGALAGKATDSTTKGEINSTAAGAGYNQSTDSLEAIRDRGDAAWLSGEGTFTEAQLDQLRGIEFIGPTATSAVPRTIVAGDDYSGSRALLFQSEALPDLSTASSITFSLRATDSARTLKITATTCVFSESPRKIAVTLTSTQTRVTPGRYLADIEAVVGGLKQTVVGPGVRFEVAEDQTQ